MENGIPNQIQPIQMPRHVLWALQLPSHVPNHDEHDLPRPHYRTSCDGLYGQHFSIHQNNGRTQTSDNLGNANIIGQ